MGRFTEEHRHKKVDGEVVMENGDPVWEVVNHPYTPEQELEADKKEADFKIEQEKKIQEKLDRDRVREDLRVKLGLTQEEFDLLSS